MNGLLFFLIKNEIYSKIKSVRRGNKMNEIVENEIKYLEKSLEEMLKASYEINKSKTSKIEKFKISKNRVYTWPILACYLSIFIFFVSGDTQDSIFLFSVLFVSGIADYYTGVRNWKSMKGQENQLALLNEKIGKTREMINLLRKKKKIGLTEKETLEKQKYLLRLWYQLGMYEKNNIPVNRIKKQYNNVLSNEEIDQSIKRTLERKDGI